MLNEEKNYKKFKLYSYVIASDSGFAPNPFGLFCSLACCKPIIRRTASVGDWVIGTGSKAFGNDKLIYAMKVTLKIDFDDYYKDKRFKNRLDNIYYKKKGEWFQVDNNHHNAMDMEHDLNGKYVLLSENFYYFGKDAIEIPERYRDIVKKGPGHKFNFSEDLISGFIRWLEKNYKPGRNGDPYFFVDDIDNNTGGCR